ncbi:MAG: glycoside hydrolase family 15 protein [Janthinobacterium lividum]
MSNPIEDYALIGDGQTAALVSRAGSIDWLCWPRFDDDACFAALLGTPENGRWLLEPAGKVISSSRRYQHDTLVMETDLETADGAIRLIDFMPMRDGSTSSLVRLVVGLRGRVASRMELRLRFDYGALPPWSEQTVDGFVAKVGPDLVVLHAPVAISVQQHVSQAQFTVEEGHRLAFVLSYSPSHLPVPSPIDAERALVATQSFWREWAGRFDDGKTEWPEAVRRSLITLKAMIHQPSGGLVAAPTTSLPEAPGGKMNWDYRYCWLRDSTFTLGALLNAGYRDEAEQWRDWLLRAIAGSPERMRIMYRIDGARHLSEWSVDSLPGYKYAVPVRVGNAASTQHQIDVFGEVLDCLNLAHEGGVPPSDQQAMAERKIVEHLEQVWNTEGSGVWESRAELRQYTYSKAMAWVGIDRFLRQYGESLSASGDEDASFVRRLSALRQTIHDEVCREGWNEGLGTFTQHYGGQEIDASLLLMPLVGFLPADDPRMKATIETIQRELSEDGLIRRMKAKSSGPNEGAFLACSFWMADCLNLLGRTDEAKAQLERVLALRNDVGLLSEEYNVPGKHLAGNFPQALSHLALINTALGLCGPVLNRGGA